MEPELDLDKVRDEKVVPVAHAVLNDMALLMVPEDASEKVDYNPIVLKILERTLDADFNIATENTYLFQLLLGALSGLNQAVQGCRYVRIDDVRYGKIGKKILSILATADIPLVGATPEEIVKAFEPVQEQLNVLIVEEKLTLIEVKYIMDNIFSGFDMVNSGFNASVADSSARAEAKLFGIETMPDLTMKQLNQVLTGDEKGDEPPVVG